MDFKQYLAEMPLSYYNWQFSQNKPDKLSSRHFDQRDRAIISHPNTAKQLERILSRTGYRFNILLYESRGQTDKDYERKVNNFLHDDEAELEGHITFVKSNTTGDALTPWMLLHTLGHGLFESVEGKQYFDQLKQTIHKFALDHWHSYADQLGNDDVSTSDAASLLARFLSFGSARNLERPHSKMQLFTFELDETIFELVAEFLWNGGKIRMKPETLKPGKYYGGYAGRWPVQLGQNYLNELKAQIEQIIKQRLDAAVGQIVYDRNR